MAVKPGLKTLYPRLPRPCGRGIAFAAVEGMEKARLSGGGEPTLTGVPILVVEDDPAGARMLQVLLTHEGADVRVAATAEEALDVLKSFSARVLIVDVVLPTMSGLHLVRLLKADPATSGLVAIAVSVVHAADVERAAVDSGCAAYLRKPIDTETFTATILTHLKGQP